MSKFNVNDVLGKLNELKAVFVLGQRAVPFIEEVFVFLKDVAPLLEEINASMMDSALKMPHATSQLQSISEATKTASAEILDLIDEVLVKSQTYEGSLEQTLSDAKSIEQSDERILELLREKLGDRQDVIADIEDIMEDRREAQHSIEGSVHARRTVVEELQSQMNRIGNSLQVQDITTQQIASVTHLLDTMRTQMSALLERLDAHQHGPLMTSGAFDVPDDAEFDPHARFDRSDERQQAIDDVFRAAVQGDGPPFRSEGIRPDLSSRSDDGLYDDTFRGDASTPQGDGAASKSSGTPVSGDDEIEHIFRNAAMAIEARRRQQSDE